jgi:hypothetical protein
MTADLLGIPLVQQGLLSRDSRSSRILLEVEVTKSESDPQAASYIFNQVSIQPCLEWSNCRQTYPLSSSVSLKTLVCLSKNPYAI